MRKTLIIIVTATVLSGNAFPVQGQKKSQAEPIFDQIAREGSIPVHVPDGLTYAEYLSLAEEYAQLLWPEQALECIRRIEISSAPKDIKEKAQRIRKNKLPKIMPPHEAIVLEIQLARQYSDRPAQRKLLDDAIKRYPNFEYLYDSLGNNLGNTDRTAAEAAIKKAIEINPNYSPAYDNLANLQEWHDRNAAMKSWETALRLDPEDGLALNRLALLKRGSESPSQPTLPFLDKIIEATALVTLPLALAARDQAALADSGVIDKKGRFLYHQLRNTGERHPYVDGYLRDDLGGTRFIDKSGTRSFGMEFDKAENFSEQLAAVCKKGNWGFIDIHGKFPVPPTLQDARPFHEGLAAAKSGGKWGYIDKSGKWIIPPKFDAAHSFYEGLAPVLASTKVGYIDRTGRMLIPPQFDAAWSFSEGRALVLSYETQIYRRHYRYIDVTGKTVFDLDKVRHSMGGDYARGKLGEYQSTEYCLAPEQKDCHSFCNNTPARACELYGDGRLLISIGGRYGYLDKSGQVAIPVKYTAAEPFSEGLAAVSSDYYHAPDEVSSQNGNYGYIDTSGNLVIPAKFVLAHNFYEGLAFVKMKDGKTGFIDKTGAMVLPVKGGDAADFHDGVADVGEIMYYP